jgi:hypothetical protein
MCENAKHGFVGTHLFDDEIDHCWFVDANDAAHNASVAVVDLPLVFSGRAQQVWGREFGNCERDRLFQIQEETTQLGRELHGVLEKRLHDPDTLASRSVVEVSRVERDGRVEFEQALVQYRDACRE